MYIVCSCSLLRVICLLAFFGLCDLFPLVAFDSRLVMPLFNLLRYYTRFVMFFCVISGRALIYEVSHFTYVLLVCVWWGYLFVFGWLSIGYCFGVFCWFVLCIFCFLCFSCLICRCSSSVFSLSLLCVLLCSFYVCCFYYSFEKSKFFHDSLLFFFPIFFLFFG